MPRRPRALRGIVLRSIVALNSLAVILLAVPLAWAIRHAYQAQAVANLEREATRVLALTSESRPDKLPDPLDPAVGVGVYDQSGRRLAGSGPESDSDARGALGDGVTRVKSEFGELAAYVPFRREGGKPVTIRVVSPLGQVRARTVTAWLALAALVVLSIGLSAVVALRRARQLARPFEQLAEAAHDLRSGGFAISVPDTGVREGDEVARALEAAARSAATRVDDAHALAEDASHQVRTPIAAASLALESALSIPGSDLETAARTALAQLDRATESLAEVLALRRDPDRGGLRGPAQPALSRTVARWASVLASTGRQAILEEQDDLREAVVADTVLRQVLDVLLDNAVKHGRGTVTVRAREVGDWLMVDVGDAGSVGDSADDLFIRGRGRGTGLGLALAQSLAESADGRLVLASHDPTRFTLALPIEGA